MKYQTLVYDHRLLSPPFNITNLFSKIKSQLGWSKIIFEKQPQVFKHKLDISNDRFITNLKDKLLLFAIGSKSTISTIWYNDYGQNKHLSIHNGRAIIVSDLYKHTDLISKQNNMNLFSVVFCNFQDYNIKDFIDRHSANISLMSHYSII